MHIIAAHPDAMLTAIGIADVVLLSWLFVRVGREQIANEDLATKEVRERVLGFYTQHLNDERASRDGLTRSESRIGHTGPTTKSNASLQV